MIISLLLMTLAVSGCVVDGGYGRRGYGYGYGNGGYGNGGWGGHEDNVRARTWGN
jgi:hypothetical protein